ncbi:MAG: DegT/DnrJ/EryC1/StrS family aminotransferase [Solobacterium sp.]|nr:DegT/DnrJ/EryC1/StrS family aminotransferase [Solobacterium sp.]
MSKNVFVTQSSMPDLEEYVQEIKDLWDSRFLTNMGTKHQALEAQLKEYLEVPYLTLFTNGHSALELLLQAYEFEKGSEIDSGPCLVHLIKKDSL